MSTHDDENTVRLTQELLAQQSQIQRQHEELQALRAEVTAALARHAELCEPSSAGYFALSRDALRQLALRHEDQLNAERRRMAREVHDHLGQILTALKLQIDWMDARLGPDPALRAGAARVRSLTESAVEVVRNVALNLRPPALDLGLAPALEWLIEDFGLRWEIEVSIVVEADDRAVDEEQATALFRIAQEALTNVARHARASRVRVMISMDEGHLRLDIEDDGVGFDPRGVRRAGSLGLLGMSERALQLGGALDISSAPGKGTRVHVRVPAGRGGRS